MKLPWLILVVGLAWVLLQVCHEAEATSQRCERYETICLQAMVDFGFGSDPELLAYIHDTIQCESRFDAAAIGAVDTDDRGLVQINRRWHPDVSDAEAFDPTFAIRYMVWHWSRNRAVWWGCYVGLAERFGAPAALRSPPYTIAQRPSGESVPDFDVMVWRPHLLDDLLRLISAPIAPHFPPGWLWIP